MDAQDVFNLLSGSINYQNLLGSQQAQAEELRIKEAQNAVENAYKAQQAQKVSRSAPYTVDGKVMIDWTDAGGNVVRREEVGKAGEEKKNMRLVRLPSGEVQSVDINTVGKLPAGSTFLGTGGEAGGGGGELTQAQKFKQDLKIAEIDQVFNTMQDSKGNEIAPESLGEYARIYNESNPTSQWRMIEGTEETFPDTAPRWVKLPKNPAEIMGLNPSTPLARDSVTGQEITVQVINDFARQKGTTPEAVLKHLGLIK